MVFIRGWRFFRHNEEDFHRWDTPYITKKGIQVRSRGEQEIADFLFDQQIRFKYEPELTLDGYTIHPDFYIPDLELYIEYFGMKTFRYSITSWWKRRLYHKHCLRFIALYPASLGSLGPTIKAAYEKKFHKKFPQSKYFDWRIKNHATGLRYTNC